MSLKNHYVYSTDPARLQELAEEYRNYCGREVDVEPGRIVVLALPRQKVKKKEERKPRDKDEQESPARGRRDQSSKTSRSG